MRESVLTWLTQMAELEPQAARRVEPAIEFPAMAAYTIDNVIAQVAIHSAHHLGQIATLRQIQGSWPLPLGSWTW